jgi:hypothetical protein
LDFTTVSPFSTTISSISKAALSVTSIDDSLMVRSQLLEGRTVSGARSLPLHEVPNSICAISISPSKDRVMLPEMRAPVPPLFEPDPVFEGNF